MSAEICDCGSSAEDVDGITWHDGDCPAAPTWQVRLAKILMQIDALREQLENEAAYGQEQRQRAWRAEQRIAAVLDSGAMDAWDIAEQMLRARAGEQG